MIFVRTRQFSVFLPTFFLLFMLLFCCSQAFAFDAGNGSSSNPYIITTAAEIKSINGLSAHYKLDADIDMAGVDFTPIGTSACKFTGSFDGNGHTISSLTIGTTSTPSSAL